jgi:hypothetical protein
MTPEENPDLYESLSRLESDELLHKLKQHYFEPEVVPLVQEIIRSRGICLPSEPDNFNPSLYRTYSGESEDEVRRRRHHQLAFVLSFISPLLMATVAWILLTAIQALEFNQWVASILYALELLLVLLLFSRIHRFLTKFDPSDFVVYPTVAILGPTLVYLTLQILVPFLSLFT